MGSINLSRSLLNKNKLTCQDANSYFLKKKIKKKKSFNKDPYMQILQSLLHSSVFGKFVWQ